MKSGIDMVQQAIAQLSVPEIQSLIDGVILPYRRPKGSTKTDIVVNSISLSNEPLQQGTFNINVHVPNLKNAKFNGILDDQQPEVPKLKLISDAIVPLFDANWQFDYNTDLEPPIAIQDSDGSWYMNIRVNYYSFIDNFQNI